ncbi:MAG: hypothetical protein JRN52_05850 [Nitrososphaerota archaeon]|nr:hypothetical protein [Nitrososphaerota archaeon]
MDSAQVKKIEEYVVLLAKQAESQEGKDDTQAIQHYVKAADILLALASKAQDQSTWEKYTKLAEAYQQKAKKRVPSVQNGSQPEVGNPQIGNSQKPVSIANPQNAPREKAEISSEAKTNRFSKFLGALHNATPGKPPVEERSPAVPLQESPPNESYSLPTAEELEKKRAAQLLAKQTSPQVHQGVATHQPDEPMETVQNVRQTPHRKALSDQEAAALSATVPYQQYVSLLAENRKLREEMKTMVPISQYEVLEARNRELIESIGSMVPREDYEKLQDRLAEMVPKSMYVDLQRSVTAMVPKEMYLESEARASSLKAQLDASIPSKTLDELATRVTVLSASASVSEHQYAMENAPLSSFGKRNLETDDDPDALVS